MTAGETKSGEILDGTLRFAKRRLENIWTPKTSETLAPVFQIPFLGEPEQESDHPDAEEIGRIYTVAVDDIVELLEQHGYADDAQKLKESCLEAIWSDGLDEVAIREIVKKALKEIDENLYAHAFNEPDLSEADTTDTL